MKKRLQGFGIGLFIAGAMVTLLTQFTDFQQTKDSDEVTQLQNQLQAAEQEIATLNEAIAQASIHTEETKPASETKDSAQSTEDEESTDNNKGKTVDTAKETESKKSDSNEEENKNSNSSTSTILIYEGVSLYDIGKQAEDQGIVENGRELELYLAKPEYARSIQIGQFELNSSMSLEEMARILTGK